MSTDITIRDGDNARHELAPSGLQLPGVIEDAGEHTQRKFIEFFTAQIANANTRKAYGRAARQFYRWCAEREIPLEDIEPIRASAYIRSHNGSDATVKQHLAALRKLYDWFVTQNVVPFNPFAPVCGPKLVRREGETPAMDAKEVRRLFAAIATDTVIGLRDRALIATMLYTFGRVSAVVNMRVKDYAPAGERKMVLNLREKGGKRHRVPAHHKLQKHLDAYIRAAGIAEENEEPLFRAANRSKELTGRTLKRQRAWEMVKRRARQAGISKDISPHSMRATGITAFLEHDGDLESAQRIAAHSDPRTAKLCDRRGEKINQGEIERIRFD